MYCSRVGCCVSPIGSAWRSHSHGEVYGTGVCSRVGIICYIILVESIITAVAKTSCYKCAFRIKVVAIEFIASLYGEFS